MGVPAGMVLGDHGHLFERLHGKDPTPSWTRLKKWAQQARRHTSWCRSSSQKTKSPPRKTAGSSLSAPAKAAHAHAGHRVRDTTSGTGLKIWVLGVREVAMVGPILLLGDPALYCASGR